MTELWELTTLIRCKNAAPFEMTVDVIAKDRASLQRILASESMRPSAVAELYGLPEREVHFVVLENVNAIKISMPRPTPSGDVLDTDVFAGQFHSPLVKLPV
jgi:hypothetical protein